MKLKLCALGLVLACRALAHEDERADAGVTPPRETTVRAPRPVHAASEAVVDRDVVDAAPRTSAVDLLRLAPGVVASQHSGEGKAAQLFLRGFDAVHGQDVELSVAGLPVNEVSHVHALGYADLNWLIPEVVRRVRVLPGTARASQGDFAVAGTVQYELGLEEEGAMLAATLGSFERQRVFAGYRPPGSPDTFAAVEHVQGAGFGPGRRFERGSLLGQAEARLGPATVRAVAGTYFSTFGSAGAVRDGTADFFGVQGAGQGGAARRHQVLVGLELPHEHGRSAVEVYGVLADLTLRNNFTGFLASPRGDGLEQRQATGTFGARLLHQGVVHVGTQHLHLELGASGKHDGVEQSQRGYDEATLTARAPDFDARVTQALASAWGEVAWQPGGWRLMLGARGDVLSVATLEAPARRPRTAFGPRLGLKVGLERQLGGWARLFASYGDGFRTPQARQLADGEGAPFVTVRSGEVGVRVETRRLSASLVGFGAYVANDFFFDHTLGTTRFLGPTARAGGTVQVTARPFEGLVASGNVTAATAQVLERGEQLPYFAPLVARVDAAWTRRFEVRGLALTPRLGFALTALGPRPLPYGEWSNPVLLLDARAGLRFEAVEVLFDVQNLADARWRDGEFVYASRWGDAANASLVPARHFTAGAPRSFFFTLEVHL